MMSEQGKVKLVFIFALISLGQNAVRMDSENTGKNRIKRGRIDPKLCEEPPTDLTVNGEYIMDQAAGKFLFIALMEVHCQFCHRQINGIKHLKKTLETAGLKSCTYMIIAPKNESVSWVKYWSDALKSENITVYQESAKEPVWTVLDGHNHDFFVYDRCGRLIYFIPHPQSNLYYHYTVSSVFAAHHYQHVGCGYCPHDTKKPRPPHTVDLYSAATSREIPQGGVSPAHGVNPPPATNTGFPTSNRRGPAWSSSDPRSDYGSRDNSLRRKILQPRPARPWYPTDDPKEAEEGWRKPTKMPTTSSSTLQSTAAPPGWMEETEDDDGGEVIPQRPLWTGSVEEEEAQTVEEPIISAVKTKYTDTESVPDSVTSVESETEETPTSSSETEAASETEISTEVITESTQTEGENIFPEDGGVDYELDEEEEATPRLSTYGQDSSTNVMPETVEKAESVTDSTTKQIPKPQAQASPTKSIAEAETKAGAKMKKELESQNESQKTKAKIFEKKRMPKFIGGASCEEYTDTVCLEQQNDIGIEKRHVCCYKGLYLTGKCVPELCTEDTLNVCCFQKFIQARYLCCHNSTLDGLKSDEFSHCCYENFVFLDNDDPCCPASVAREYWNEKTSLYELCLPNVDIEFKDMILEAKLRDNSELKLNLGQQKVLQYTCPYSNLRDSFFYWQPPTKAPAQNGTEDLDSAIEEAISEIEPL